MRQLGMIDGQKVTVETAKFGTAKFGKLQSSNPFQHDCLIRHINMCKINCQVRKPKVQKLISSALYLGRTLQFFHIILAKKEELCSDFLEEHLFCFGAELCSSLTSNSAKTTELKKRF